MSAFDEPAPIKVLIVGEDNLLAPRWISIRERQPEPGTWYVGLEVYHEREKGGGVKTCYTIIRGYPNRRGIDREMSWWLPLPTPLPEEPMAHLRNRPGDMGDEP